VSFCNRRFYQDDKGLTAKTKAKRKSYKVKSKNTIKLKKKPQTAYQNKKIVISFITDTSVVEKELIILRYYTNLQNFRVETICRH
jgi:hypothetical protein